jgi:hypothetical protein
MPLSASRVLVGGGLDGLRAGVRTSSGGRPVRSTRRSPAAASWLRRIAAPGRGFPPPRHRPCGMPDRHGRVGSGRLRCLDNEAATAPRPGAAPAARAWCGGEVQRSVHAWVSRQYHRTSLQALPPSGTIWLRCRLIPHIQHETTVTRRAAKPSEGGVRVSSAMTASPPDACRDPRSRPEDQQQPARSQLARQPLTGMLTHGDLAGPAIRPAAGIGPCADRLLLCVPFRPPLPLGRAAQRPGRRPPPPGGGKPEADGPGAARRRCRPARRRSPR